MRSWWDEPISSRALADGARAVLWAHVKIPLADVIEFTQPLQKEDIMPPGPPKTGPVVWGD